MSTADFIAQLRALDIVLAVDGERLRCNAPKGALTPELREQLAARKSEILAWLSAQPARDAAQPTELSFAQQRLWFIDQLQPGGFAYNITGGLRLRGTLDVGALESSIAEVVRRHEPLRTVFVAADGRPRAVVLPFNGFRLDVESATEESVEQLLVEEGRKPFDLARGPLFRARLFRLAPEDHVLQITLHHIVADGWSLGVLSAELTTLYQGRMNGGSTELPPLSASYADVVKRQRTRLSGAALDAQSRYWRERMTPLPPTLELPTDRPRPALQTYDGSFELFDADADIANGLRALASRNGATLFMTLLAAYDVLLHRYTGLTDIAVGVPIANRTDVDAENVIGLLANTLVLRTDLGGDPSFLDVLRRVRDVALGAYANQDLPFERLVEMVQPARDTSHSALFQVMFILQNSPFQPLRFGDLSISPMEIRTGGAKNDLTLEAFELKDGLRFSLEYNVDLFDAATIRRMGEHFLHLLRAIIASPDKPIGDLPLMDADEWRTTVAQWNATDAPIEPVSVSRLFERQACCTPDAVALVFEDRALTYANLNAAANRLAHYLRGAGVSAGSRVGIMLDRSIDMVVAVLAVMKTGAAYVPLDPAFPAERLAFMAHDAGLRLVVTRTTLRDRIALPAPTRGVLVDADAAEIAAEPSTNLEDEISPEAPAYVLYTSGSTGKPKGVVVPHRAFVNLLTSFARDPGAGRNDVLVAVTTLSFDIAGLELMLPLITGARLVLASRETAVDPNALGALLERAGATLVQATPATWRMLLDGGWQGLPGLRVLCGGEPLPPALARELIVRGARVWNVYGPTETTIWSTIHAVTGTESRMPIGRPIANTRVYVLDARGNPAPVGVPGELYIGGAGVALGYHDRPDLTAQRFLPDPFASEPGARMYRTGDVVRQRADGVLEYIGRTDHQVKVRGFRIELAEIETVLAAHPAVSEAVVVTREARPGEPELAAYVRLSNGRMPDPQEYRTFLRERLPEYMVPSWFTVLDAFPLTPNGKVDRLRLPEPQGRRAAARAPFHEPRDEFERAVAAVWRDVLHIDHVGVDDNFFDLGGHSLLLVQAQAKIRAATGRDIAIVDMFRFPTIRTLAAHVAGRGRIQA